MRFTSDKYGAIRRSSALCVGAAALLLALLSVYAGLAKPVGAAAEYIRVPGDAATIQEAVDSAESGAEIRVQGGEYFEHIVITKSVRLSGSWTGDFSVQDTQNPTIIKGSGSGRPVTVFTVDVTPTVVMSYMVIMEGNASGLGGVVTPTVALVSNSSAAAAAAPITAGTPPVAATIAQLRADLEAQAAAGRLPGGEQALKQLLLRLDAAAQAGAITAEALAGSAPHPVAVVGTGAVDEIDCGGGIYVRDAYLHLILVNVSRNIASEVGTGAGGGICAVHLPVGGLQLERVTIAENKASQSSSGYGGGFFYSGGDTPPTGAVAFNNVRVSSNIASESSGGYGGGVFVTQAPSAAFTLTMVGNNFATHRGLRGVGGGFYLAESADVQMSLVGFEGNTATNSAAVNDANDYAVGSGGGLYAINTPRLLITSPEQGGERSMFVGNLGVLRGVGNGGALFLQDAPGLRIERTDFSNNWALFSEEGLSDFEGGGAIFCTGCDAARIVDSGFANNVVGLYSVQGSKLNGGAMSIGQTRDLSITGSRFEGNTTGPSSSGGLGNGGAVEITDSAVVTISSSSFENNVADSGPIGGLGGALHFKQVNDLLIEQNTFTRNRAGTGAGIGGALVLERGGNGVQWWPEPVASAQIDAQISVNERVAIRKNTFLDNSAAVEPVNDEIDLGGAIAVNGTNGIEVTNNVLAGNGAENGGALALIGWDRQAYSGTVANAAVTNNTLFNNGGSSGIYAELWTTPVTFTNNIFVSHTAAIHVATNAKLGGMTAGALYNLYDGNGAISEVDAGSTLQQLEQIAGAPGFVEPWANNFHLLPTSSAIDAGDPAGVPPASPVDIENVQRPFGTRVDVGAYEWHGPLNYLPSIYRDACETLPREGWAIGEGTGATRTVIMHTVDGINWARQYTSTLKMSGLAVVDAQSLWASGEHGTILHSVDGGSSWQKQAVPQALASADINSISAVSSKIAWAVAAVTDPLDATNKGYVLGTKDGGATWAIQTSVPTQKGWINWISAADANNVWFVGGTSASLAGQSASATGDGYIYHSGDAGLSWQQQLTAESGPVIGIDAVSPTIAWAAGRSAAYRTLDGGQTWTTYPVVALDANHVDSIGGKYVWVSGDYFTVMYTDDGLAQPLPLNAWQDRTPKAANAKVAYAVDFVDTMNGWIAGGKFTSDAGGVIARTCDGGINWQLSQWADLDPIRIVQMVPDVLK